MPSNRPVILGKVSWGSAVTIIAMINISPHRMLRMSNGVGGGKGHFFIRIGSSHMSAMVQSAINVAASENVGKIKKGAVANSNAPSTQTNLCC